MIQPVFLRINGNAHAFSRELGCNCRRCQTIQFSMKDPVTNSGGPLAQFSGWNDPPWRANTSVSILLPNKAKPEAVAHHILIDAGAGIVDSLVCSRIENLHKINGILITHWHPDHTLGLNQFAESVKRSCKRRHHSFSKIPFYSTQHTYSMLYPKFSYEFDEMLSFQEIVSGKPFSLPNVADIQFTPIEIIHGTVKGSVIFVAEFSHHKKCIFMWDIDHPRATRYSDNKSNIEIIREHKNLLEKPDLLFLEINGWTARAPGHGSLIDAQQYLDVINPRKVILLHLSGHSDKSGQPAFGWSDDQWRQNLKYNSPFTNFPMIIGNQGMILSFNPT